MEIKETAYKIEELQIKAEKVHSLGVAISEALLYGYNAPKAYEWAMCLLEGLTFEMKNELGEARDELFEFLRDDNEERTS